MNSILNSISSGNLQVQQLPRVKPVKEDSIIELLQNSEIEFETCPKKPNKLDNFNTGFGENNDLHYETKCKLPNLKTPLYQENFLKEFKTEEDKASARHSLGIYNKGDVVAMSLLTTKTNLPTSSELKNAIIKQMCQGDKFFLPITSMNAVLDLDGVSLNTHLNNMLSLIKQQQKEITNINEPSNLEQINSLGDVKLFLKGFSNGDNLFIKIDNINQEMLRFESTGQIKN